MTLRSDASLFAASILLGASLLASGTSAFAGGEPTGPQLFVDQKCSTCHAVSAAGIEAKTKSEKMKGPDLSGYVWEGEFSELAAYLRKEAEEDGTKHKGVYKGSDEELEAIMAWVGSLEKPADD